MTRFPTLLAAQATVCAAMTLWACGATVSRTIRAEWIGSPKARLTVYMRSADQEEDTQGGIRHDVIRDEATLAKLDDAESCFDLVIRTSATYDEPFDQLDPSCGSTQAVVESEKVSVYDYNFSGERQKLGVNGVAADVFVGLSITEPAEMIFRVIERSGRVCCIREPGDKDVRLQLTSDRMLYRNASYAEEFIWQVR